MKKTLSIILIIVLIFSLAGCKKDNKSTETTTNEASTESTNMGYPMTIVDSMGRNIIIESMPKRIVSSVPSNTEIVYALGKGDNLVGVSVYCNYPEAALSVEKIGDYNGPNIELIINLKPDVFLAAYIEDGALNQLENAGIKVVMVNPGNLAETYSTIEMIGNIIGASEEADNLLNKMKIKQNEIINKVKGYEKRTVFYEIWHEPLMTAGPGSFINELIQLANGKNIADDAESAYPEFSLERLISRNPQVYITADDGFKTAEDIFSRQGYINITAIKTGQLFMLNQDIVSRPGPRIIEGFEFIARAIHPEAFDDK
jgi:iron complex transport system substrate-binding protein